MKKLTLRDMAGEPDTLSRFEVDLENEPVTTDPKPKKARAWVRYSGRAMRVTVYVLAWTVKAVRVRWAAGAGARHEAWAWMPAVENTAWVEM